jgi:hypothetical protein
LRCRRRRGTGGRHVADYVPLPEDGSAADLTYNHVFYDDT